MALALVNSKPEDAIYKKQLQSSILSISPILLEKDIWDRHLVLTIPRFDNRHLGIKSPICFDELPILPKLELKHYWALFFSDSRNNSRSIVERRLQPMEWLNLKWSTIKKRFSVSSLSDIPHPEFPHEGLTCSNSKKQHNRAFIELYEKYATKHLSAQVKVAISGEIKVLEYKSPRITIVGGIHKFIVIQREQFLPLQARNIIYLNDIFNEEDTRFIDRQRHNNIYLNLYLYPTWMRDAVRTHILQKVNYGELAPSTSINMFSRFLKFRDFLYEKYENPDPNKITNTLIEDDFIAWGNEKGLTGKNWWTDTVAMLNAAAKSYPNIWPKLSIQNRQSKKIKKVHYKSGLGRIGHSNEGAGRSYSPRIVNEISQNIHKTPPPCAALFFLMLATGARCEDGHAILFDCLNNDPNDEQFMLLSHP